MSLLPADLILSQSLQTFLRITLDSTHERLAHFFVDVYSITILPPCLTVFFFFTVSHRGSISV